MSKLTDTYQRIGSRNYGPGIVFMGFMTDEPMTGFQDITDEIDYSDGTPRYKGIKIKLPMRQADA